VTEIFVPAVNVASVYPVPLPISNWPYAGAAVTPVPPYDTAIGDPAHVLVPVMLTPDSGFVPFAIPLMALTNWLKLTSRSDAATMPVIVPNVYVTDTGKDIMLLQNSDNYILSLVKIPPRNVAVILLEINRLP
jgi:hypothetical protein